MIVAAVLLIVVLVGIAGYLEKWLWMRQLHYLGIFWTLLSVQWAMFGVAFVFAFVFCGSIFALPPKPFMPCSGAINWIVSHLSMLRSNPRKISSTSAQDSGPCIGVSGRLRFPAICTGLSLEWDTYLRFRYGGHFGLLDPLFRVDVGFYLFRLPFYELLQGSFVYLTLMPSRLSFFRVLSFGLLRLSPGGKMLSE